MNKERVGLPLEKEIQFTEGGLPSSFSVEDYAVSLPDDNLREMLLNITPLGKKGEFFQMIEMKNKMPLEILLFNLYWVYRKSGIDIKNEIGVSIYVVYNRMRESKIPIRSASSAGKNKFEDPIKKKKFIENIHNPESNSKRVGSIKQWHKLNEGEIRRRTIVSWERRRKERKIYEREALGIYPKFALFRLHYIEGYSVEEISQRTGIRESRIKSLMKEHGVKNLDNPLARNSKHIAEVNNSIDRVYKKEAKLTLKEKYVIFRRYIDPEYNLVTLEEVGKELGDVSREDIRQIEDSAVRRLRS